jgi:membrane protease YdiL (CAAX protease family)
VFVLTFAGLSYADRSAHGSPDRDVLYQWTTAENYVIQFGLIAVIVWGIAGLGRRRDLFALRAPRSWRRAAAIATGVIVGMFVLTAVLGPILHPGKEQGLTPSSWDSSRAAQYVVNGLAVCILAPVVEELTFRGLGFSLLRRYGNWTAIVLVGLLFGLAHGLVAALPLLAAFGAGLAYLRSRSDSVYPGMVVHGLFNAAALVFAVTH